MAEKRKYPIYEELAAAYDFYNKELFGNLLPQCIIILTKKVNSYGHFSPENFIASDGSGKKLHEIALNVQMFAVRSLELTLSTLVHEMCHLRTFEDGNYGRGAYHNKIWAGLMKEKGLMPSTTGVQGGGETGQHVSHYIEEGGIFERKTRELIERGFLIPFVERFSNEVKSFTEEEISKKAVRGKPGFYKDDEGEIFEGKTVVCGKDENGEEVIKVIVKEKKSTVEYRCKCEARVWGRRGLDIKCNVCGKNFKNMDGD